MRINSKGAASRLAASPQLLSAAQGAVRRWLAGAAPDPSLLEWQQILDSGLDATLSVLLGSDKRSVRLRGSSPFARGLFPGQRPRKNSPLLAD